VAALQTITVDCAHVQTRDDFWRVYLSTVKPEGAELFGRNLDAFWDALAGGPGWPGECVLRFVNTAPLKRIDDGRFYGALIKIAQDSRIVQVIVE
jgi:RNAse (barnase) inhibitor barstar